MQKNNYLLEIKDLTIEKDNITILENINLEVKENEIFGVLGSNGAGKSSLAYAIMGVKGFTISSGEIIYKGKDITDLKIHEKAKLGIALSWQEPVRFQGMTVREYLSLGNSHSEKELIKYLNSFGLKSKYLDRKIDDKLSGGERKRIELASIFALEPKLMILDEPDSNIDIHGVKNLKELLRNKHKELSIILISHQQEIVDISDRVTILCNGKMEKIGKTKELLYFFNNSCKSCEKVDHTYIGD